MGSGGKGGDESTIRFAPYIEDHHKTFLDIVATRRGNVIDESPYDDYTNLEIDAAFFGTGYVLSSFPSLYDMYGKFMAGLDVEVLYTQVFEDTVESPPVNEMFSAEATRLSDDIIEEGLPRFETGQRDVNSVMSSTFVIGRGMLETGRTKALSRFSAEIRYRLLPLVNDRWKAHLDWNKQVTETYSQILKFYIIAKMDVDNHNLEVSAKDTLWPFSVLEHERLALGALTGAKDITKDVSGASTAQKAIGGALSGAAAGTMVTGTPIGAAIGGAIGLAGGLF